MGIDDNGYQPAGIQVNEQDRSSNLNLSHVLVAVVGTKLAYNARNLISVEVQKKRLLFKCW